MRKLQGGGCLVAGDANVQTRYVSDTFSITLATVRSVSYHKNTPKIIEYSTALQPKTNI